MTLWLCPITTQLTSETYSGNNRGRVREQEKAPDKEVKHGNYSEWWQIDESTNFESSYLLIGLSTDSRVLVLDIKETLNESHLFQQHPLLLSDDCFFHRICNYYCQRMSFGVFCKVTWYEWVEEELINRFLNEKYACFVVCQSSDDYYFVLLYFHRRKIYR